MKLIKTSFLLSILILPCLAYAQCEIDCTPFIPKQSRQPVIAIGSQVILAKTSHHRATDEPFLQVYEYVREATKKEIKKPENLEDDMFLIDSKIYTDNLLGGNYMFKNVENIPEIDFIIDGFLNLKLIQVATISEVEKVVFTIKSIDDEAQFIVLSSPIGEFIYFCSVNQRQLRFSNVVDETEIESRKKATIEFIGKTFTIGEMKGGMFSGKIIDIIVEPYLTKVRFEFNGKTRDFDIQADKGCFIYDSECLEQLEEKRLEEIRLFNEKNANKVDSNKSNSSTCSTVQCSGTTQSGNRCKNRTTNCNGRCHLH